MKSELDFLNKLASELSEVEYGEGISFNLQSINNMVMKRIQELNTNNPNVCYGCEYCGDIFKTKDGLLIHRCKK